MNYWSRTAEYLNSHGGKAPNCPTCGKEMTPEDDHGRFVCFGCGYGRPLSARISQVPTEGMADGDKAKVHPMSRLDSESTDAEKKVLNMLVSGDMDDPEYQKACRELEEERGRSDGSS